MLQQSGQGDVLRSIVQACRPIALESQVSDLIGRHGRVYGGDKGRGKGETSPSHSPPAGRTNDLPEHFGTRTIGGKLHA